MTTRGKMPSSRVAILIVAFLMLSCRAASLAAAQRPARVARIEAELLDMTTGVPRCGMFGPQYVTVKYRVLQVLEGPLRTGEEVVVAQACGCVPPTEWRGQPRPASYNGLWWGDRGVLHLEPYVPDREMPLIDQLAIDAASIQWATDIGVLRDVRRL